MSSLCALNDVTARGKSHLMMVGGARAYLFYKRTATDH